MVRLLRALLFAPQNSQVMSNSISVLDVVRTLILALEFEAGGKLKIPILIIN
jgi:hypothetical protein